MGQYWKIIDIDAEEGIEYVDGGVKLQEFFWRSDIDHSLVDLLLVRSFPVAQLASRMRPSTNDVTSSDSKLLHLPNELLLAIVTNLTTLQDAVCFALTHNKLGAIACQRLCELMTPELSPWAGHRLACIGDYTDTFPEHLQEVVAAKLSETDDESFYSYAYEFWPRIVPCRGGIPSLVDHIQMLFEDLKLTTQDTQRLREFLNILRKIDIEEIKDINLLVLCNLTMGTYVKGSAMKTKFGERLSLGVLLLSHICWSDDTGFVRGSRVAVERGRWAGHRFEITTITEMRPGVAWTDVTETYVTHLEELWRSSECS